MKKIVLLRHGESAWNKENRFTGNAKFVTVMPYLWNGKKKELLEREEEVEQRGAEIGQQ